MGSLVFSPDGVILAYRFRTESGPTEPVRLWNTRTQKERTGPDDFHPGGALCFSPDGKRYRKRRTITTTMPR